MMDIEKLAREAGIQDPETYHGDPKRDCPWIANTNELRRFAALVAEACAQIAQSPVAGEQDDITMAAKDRVAAAIRERFKD